MKRSSNHRPLRKNFSTRLARRRRLVSEALESRLLLAAVVTVAPESNAQAPTSTNVTATFDENVTSVTPQTFVVHATRSRGQLSGVETTVTAAGPAAQHDPANDFRPGELIQATVTSGVTTSGGAATPHVWQFRAEVTSGSGVFVDSGQLLLSNSNSVSFADFDGDGDLDVVGGSVMLNDGSGVFSDSGQTPGGEFVDVDGDGDLDAAGNGVWLNDGNGVFNDTGQSLGGGAAAFGDIDGDGDMDVMKGVAYGAKRVWFNNGSGVFTESAQRLGSVTANSIDLVDLDNDGDLDAFSANFGGPNRAWFNDGSGVFTDSGQPLGSFTSTRDGFVGDVDGDGDMDLVEGNDYGTGGPRIWLNDGAGAFTSGQTLDAGFNTRGITLGDFDGDGDLDIVVQSLTTVRVWSNDGTGAFTGGNTFTWPGSKRAGRVELGDVDGDGDLDIWAANYTAAGSRLFINQNLQPNVTLSVDSATINEAEGTATVTATLSAAHTQPVTVDLGFSGTATATTDYTVSAMQIVIPAGATSGTTTLTAVQDALDEPDETVIVDIVSAANAQETGTQQITVTITDDDEPLSPNVTLALDHLTITEAAGVATFSIELSAATTAEVTVELEFTGTATAGADYLASATQIVFQPGTTAATVTVTAVQDDVDEPDETVIVGVSSVSGGIEVGEQQQTTTILDDDDPLSFVVTSIAETASGFLVEFNNPLNTVDLNLYDTRSLDAGPADVMVSGAASGSIAGSLLVRDQAVEFIKSGGPLAADTYTVTLRSGLDAFSDAAGQLLDGNRDGIGGDDFASSFTVAPSPAEARVISIPDFVRGPGQGVNLPADETAGIPISISDGSNVRAADIRIAYDPQRLEITGATAAAGGTVVVNTDTTPGVAILVYFASASLPPGASTFINLQATVPGANASTNYGSQQLLDLHAVTISDGLDNEFPVVVDDALHFVTYFADVSGNGRVNASDAAQVARLAALLDSGFSASLSTDPVMIGDISGNNRVNAADASLVAQFVALIPIAEIPDIPAGLLSGGSIPSFPTLVADTQQPLAPDPLDEAPAEASAGEGDQARIRALLDFNFEPLESSIVDTIADQESEAIDAGVDDLLAEVLEEAWEL